MKALACSLLLSSLIGESFVNHVSADASQDDIDAPWPDQRFDAPAPSPLLLSSEAFMSGLSVRARAASRASAFRSGVRTPSLGYPLRSIVASPGIQRAMVDGPRLHFRTQSGPAAKSTSTLMARARVHTPRTMLSSSTSTAADAPATEEEEEEEEEDRLGAGARGGHAVPEQPEISAEEMELQKKVMEHQKAAALLSPAEEARSLVEYADGYATISTISSHFEGYPGGGVVQFAVDEEGRPILCLSGLSTHGQDLIKNQKAAVTIRARDFKGLSDGRVSLVGTMTRVTADETAPLKEAFLRKHPEAYWVNFGDFKWYRMDEVVGLRFVGGFARVGDIDPAEYLAAKPDDIMAFSGPVAGHMNADHGDANVAMVKHYIGLPVDTADITTLDRLGMTLKVTREGQSMKLRLPFIRPAESRKEIKDILVDMTRAAKGASAPAEDMSDLDNDASA
ncbi:unnamed protein product [Vitrella brassicaformis CCMP3155]|uniref:Uncharacterized protein n=2 Tax=Vitrella brassicaformis TaxID=1169539 RepID=A0A0G4EZX3_VITBC|nr:unnamed protein product [Vitrella brassicaformis CCMP3155]|eukprot:CEM04601.1 unnamed protein product [Vitrella brassicaformis CCMP3155]